MPNNRMRNLKKTENDEINHLTWIWFKKARSQNIPISGPILQEAAKMIKNLRTFVTNNEPCLIEDINSLEKIFSNIQIRKLSKKKQTSIFDCFNKV